MATQGLRMSYTGSKDTSQISVLLQALIWYMSGMNANVMGHALTGPLPGLKKWIYVMTGSMQDMRLSFPYKTWLGLYQSGKMATSLYMQAFLFSSTKHHDNKPQGAVLLEGRNAEMFRLRCQQKSVQRSVTLYLKQQRPVLKTTVVSELNTVQFRPNANLQVKRGQVTKNGWTKDSRRKGELKQGHAAI